MLSDEEKEYLKEFLLQRANHCYSCVMSKSVPENVKENYKNEEKFIHNILRKLK